VPLRLRHEGVLLARLVRKDDGERIGAAFEPLFL
jgi:hypothetical protein